ncbi:FUSC family protein [Enterococcus asini]|uniref:FUSC family protein n=1 Tax=Enterococcus asini TaxID=57732 RepID=UPI00288F4C43|nr:FUSC family protein [Enterococcus asini]MDT2744874.1 FUSC family protein [Enterococcus asini]
MHAFINEITHFKQIPDDPYQLVGAFCCMLIPLLIGYFSGNMTSASFMSFGSLTFLYSKKQAARTLLPRMFLIGLLLLAGHAFDMLAITLPWTAPFVVSFFGFFSRLIFRLYKITNPGAFFVVMVTAVGTSTNVALSKQLLISCYFLLGIGIALLTAWILCAIRPVPLARQQQSFQERLYTDPGALLSSLFFGNLLMIATYLSQSIQLENPYWMVISTATILQGNNLRAMMERNVQRILETLLGIGFAAFLLNISLALLPKIFLISFFFVTVEFIIKHNYAIANFFITPMSLLLISLAKQQFLYSLLPYRFLGIILGGLLGLLGAWIMITCLRFYNRTLQIHETFDQESE